jgi:hypothetical protein
MRGRQGQAAFHHPLASVLQRDRKAVHRDVRALRAIGRLVLRKEIKPRAGAGSTVICRSKPFSVSGRGLIPLKHPTVRSPRAWALW